MTRTTCAAIQLGNVPQSYGCRVVEGAGVQRAVSDVCNFKVVVVFAVLQTCGPTDHATVQFPVGFAIGFADQPYITNYRVYDDRVGETTRFTNRADHEWYWFPQQQPNEVSMLKCYDSVTDGAVSRWSFHTACVDPTVPRDAPCRKNVVVRSFVFF